MGNSELILIKSKSILKPKGEIKEMCVYKLPQVPTEKWILNPTPMSYGTSTGVQKIRQALSFLFLGQPTRFRAILPTL